MGIDDFFEIVGGCGAMYDVLIEAEDFNGKKLVQQHMMVNKVGSTVTRKQILLCAHFMYMSLLQ